VNYKALMLQDHKPDLDDERKRIENEGGDVMEKGGIQRVVWKRPVFGPRGTVCSSSATEKIPFLAISRALGVLCFVPDDTFYCSSLLCILQARSVIFRLRTCSQI